MASAALFDLLPDFGSRTSAASQVPKDHGDVQHMPAAPAPQADIGALIAEAVADAEAALEARLALSHQAALDAERQASDDAAKAFLESFGGDLGAAVAKRIEAADQEMVDAEVVIVDQRIGDLFGRADQPGRVALRARHGG